MVPQTRKCRACHRAECKKWAGENQDRLKAYSYAYYHANKDAINAYNHAYYAENRERTLEQKREYYEENCEKIAVRNSAHYFANRDRVLAQVANYTELNADYLSDRRAEHIALTSDIRSEERRHRWHADPEWRAERMAKMKDWQTANPHKMREYSLRRHATKLKATPPWLTQEQLDEMRSMHAHANDCYAVSGQVYHVDHIVPLQGKNVSGLHVPWNLQVLPADLNIAKHNKYEGPDAW